MFYNACPKGYLATFFTLCVFVLCLMIFGYSTMESHSGGLSTVEISHNTDQDFVVLNKLLIRNNHTDIIHQQEKDEVSVNRRFKFTSEIPSASTTQITILKPVFTPALDYATYGIGTTDMIKNTVLQYCQKYWMDTWDFNCAVPCPHIDIHSKTESRDQVQISCFNHGAHAKLMRVEATETIPHVLFNSTCSLDLISRYCASDYSVPNIIHYVWFSRRRMNVYHYISFLSVYKIMNPCLILIHGDATPYGEYWELLLQQVPTIVHIFRQPPNSIFGREITKIEHKADIARIEALQVYGGIYFDTDEVLLRSLEELRHFPLTLSHAVDNNLSNGLIMAAPNATFLTYWLNSYKTFDPEEWAYHSTIIPYKLSKIYPDLLHIENKTFVRPNFTQMPLIVEHNFNWSDNYAIHLYIRYVKKRYAIDELRHLNTTIGSVARHVLFGSKELCSD